MRAHVVIASICLSVAGCGPSANRIEPIYVAPHQYESLSCEEIAGEAQSVARSAAAMAGAPRGNTEAGAKVIVWPTMAFAKTSKEVTSALGRLKGAFDALVLAAKTKSCDLDFQQAGDQPQDEAAGAAPP
jgi:hypothetical protein